jgi:hypothetical protein
VSNDEKMRHLEDVPLLAECTQKQLRAISDISRVVEVPAGTSLTRAGQPGDEFFVILDGSAAVEKPGKKRVFLRPGDFFGGDEPARRRSALRSRCARRRRCACRDRPKELPGRLARGSRPDPEASRHASPAGFALSNSRAPRSFTRD